MALQPLSLTTNPNANAKMDIGSFLNSLAPAVAVQNQVTNMQSAQNGGPTKPSSGSGDVMGDVIKGIQSTGDAIQSVGGDVAKAGGDLISSVLSMLG